jgi:FKBP-type peptidyl-prolyl cis-trans isomerase SlyD
MMDSQGHRLMGSVLEVKSDVVVMDFNHPLAGETLNFDGEVIDVHDPTPQELVAMQQGDGCGCNCEGEGDCDDCK